MKGIRFDRLIAVLGMGVLLSAIGGGFAVGIAHALGMATKVPLAIGVAIGFPFGCLMAGLGFSSGDADEDMGYK